MRFMNYFFYLKILHEFDKLWNLKIQKNLMNFMTCTLGSCIEEHFIFSLQIWVDSWHSYFLLVCQWAFWFKDFSQIWWALKLEDSDRISMDFMECILGSYGRKFITQSMGVEIMRFSIFGKINSIFSIYIKITSMGFTY